MNDAGVQSGCEAETEKQRGIQRVLTMLLKLRHIKNLRLFNVLLKITPVLLTIHVCVEYAPRGLIMEAQ